MTVDAELASFETDLAWFMSFELEHVDMDFWDEMDAPSSECLRRIRNAPVLAFSDLRRRYIGTSVELVILRAVSLLRTSLWSSMNVPCPRNPMVHLQCVFNNLSDIYLDHVQEELKAAMIDVSSSAQIIQRSWRLAISSPSHPICQRRLLAEFAIM